MTQHPQWLYRWEAKGIQRYILQSDRLRHLRGASNAVVALGEAARERALRAKGSVEQSTAGVGVYAFPDLAALREMAEGWPAEASTLCPGLQIAHGWLRTDTATADVLSQLVRRVAADRNRPAPVLPEAGPFIERAPRTGRPAVSRRDDEVLDAALARFADETADAKDRLAEEFGLQGELQEDLQRWPEGYVAVIHADGNGVGRRVERMGLADLHTFSQDLQKATRAAARTAVATVESARRQMGGARWDTLPLRPIVLGGDDVTVIVHAELALDFVTSYLEAFERETSARKAIAGGQPLRAAAGIAFVNRKFPFAHAHELAESLAKAAKRTSRERSLLLFHRVTTSSIDDWDAIRERELGGGVLAYGPYGLVAGDPEPSVAGLTRLADVVRGARVGRGALRGWVGLVLEEASRGRGSSTRSEARWDRIREVLTERKAWGPLHQALESVGAGPEAFRRPGPGADIRGATPVFDALTLNALGARLHRGEH